MAVEAPCAKCGGEGRIIEKQCPTCRGDPQNPKTPQSSRFEINEIKMTFRNANYNIINN
jgi:DnaJ-class molecular chaperone